MNKLKLLVTLCFITSIFTYSQEFTVGIKGGVNYSSIGDINSIGASFSNPPVPDEVFEPNKEIGTQFGGYLMVNFGNFMIRPEILFTSLKNSYDFPTNTAGWSSSSIEIPVLFGYEIYRPITVYAGPVITSVNDLEIDGTEHELSFDKRDINLGVGIMVDFGRFGFDLRYVHSTTEEPEQPANFVFNSAGQTSYGINKADIYAYKLNIISLSAHVNIFRTDKERMGSFFGGLFKGDKCYCPYD